MGYMKNIVTENFVIHTQNFANANICKFLEFFAHLHKIIKYSNRIKCEIKCKKLFNF